ncbi:MAG: hypothetical protein AVDCRST_MAG25-1243, partial [uncultured Rubrobacteraceae bacterium]
MGTAEAADKGISGLVQGSGANRGAGSRFAAGSRAG